jgi:hypothetical protein
MKHQFSILLINLLLINFSFSQHKYPLIKDVNIELIKYGVNNRTTDCSKNISSPEEKKYEVYFEAKFRDFSTKKTIDFNNISLVDTDNKIRYRPLGVSYRQYDSYASTANLKEYKYEDTFTKNSLEGIENYDFFLYDRNIITLKKRKKPKYRYRIKPNNFKIKKGLKLNFRFPAFKTRKDSGNFKIYWKKELIGIFKILDGKPI